MDRWKLRKPQDKLFICGREWEGGGGGSGRSNGIDIVLLLTEFENT